MLTALNRFAFSHAFGHGYAMVAFAVASGTLACSGSSGTSDGASANGGIVANLGGSATANGGNFTGGGGTVAKGGTSSQQGGLGQGGGATGSGGMPAGGTISNSGGAPSGGSATGGSAVGGSTATGGAASGGAATNGGSSTGGAAKGGAGGASTGGTNNVGGSATGGAAAGGKGGTATGGATTGGATTGGAATGGAATGGAATGGAATGGGNGLPTVPDNGCNVLLTDKPIGFAAQATGTVGGGSVTPILVTTAAQLTTYLSDSQARVLYIMNDLDFRTANRTGVATCNETTKCDNGSGVMIEEPRVSTSCSTTEYASTSYRNETRLNVASNKTVIGIGTGSGASIRGASFNIGASQQVIFRNLRVYDINPHLVEAGDGFTLQGSRYVWLDHLLLEQISDGLIDVGSADHNVFDQNVTLSWIHFNGRTAYQCGGKHHYVNAVDNSQITYHHNWYDNCNGRNPKIGQASSQVHLFNNYWLNITYFCITAQTDSEARVESNYFENSLKPHWRQTDGSGTAGIAIDTGNAYTGVSTGNTSRDVGGTVFTVPYTYTKETAATAKTNIVKCSGPQPIH